MELFPYQRELVEEGKEILNKYKIVYLSMEQRTGKCIVATKIAESLRGKSVGIITKRKAVDGWLKILSEVDKEKMYTISSYQSAAKGIGNGGIDPNCDVVILDESHSNISGVPELSQSAAAIKELCKGKPIIYTSATPYIQGTYQLFHQLFMSSYSPWIHYSYYNWFLEYANYESDYDRKNKIVPQIWVRAGKKVPDYKNTDTNRVLADVRHLFVSIRRKEAGFQEEPTDKVHYIELKEATTKLYNRLIGHRFASFDDINGRQHTQIAEEPATLMHSLYMLEGGVQKVNEEYIQIDEDSKIQYIKDTWGDTKDLVIAYHYVAEGAKLKKAFKNALILQYTAFAEGVDLSMYETLVIHSGSFSGSSYSQIRARQANVDRTIPIVIHFLLVKDAISSQVYEVISQRMGDFNERHFVSRRISNEN